MEQKIPNLVRGRDQQVFNGRYSVLKAPNEDQDLILVDRIFDNKTLSVYAKVVGLFLAGCAHNQVVWPSLTMISKKCKITKFVALKAIQELKSQGFLKEISLHLESEAKANV